MQFNFLILLTAILLLRPADIISALQGLPLYQGVIALCLLVSFAQVFKQLSLRALIVHPISFCMVGLLFSCFLSRFSHGQIGLAIAAADSFLRICVFYFLLVGTIDTRQKLRRYLVHLGLIIAVLTALPLLQYHEVINLEGLKAVLDRESDVNVDSAAYVQRIVGPGIFNDPNDFCLILAFGILICMSLKDTGPPGLGRWVSMAPAPFFLYALALTRSRGGLIMLAAGLLGYFGSRYGMKRGGLILLLCAPLSMVLLSGRQTDITLSGGTSHQRVSLWRDGMVLFKQYPIFGIGVDKYADEMGLVAHNSFVHAYVELGFLGGTLFLTPFVFTYRSIRSLEDEPAVKKDEFLWATKDLIAGAFCAFGAGFLSISRCYFVPTYLLFGLATCFFNLVDGVRTRKPEAIDGGMLVRYGGISVAALLVLSLFLRIAP